MLPEDKSFTVPRGRVLVIAGSDSGGGAGIQADVKTITMLGAYAMTAVTAITAQNTEGVHGIWSVPAEFISKQIEVCVDDIGVDAVKIGMVGNEMNIRAIVASLSQIQRFPLLVLDPVMIAKGGQSLLDAASVDAVKYMLIPKSFIVTPNIPEAETLTGVGIHSITDMMVAAEKIKDMGAANVLIKGGHMQGNMITDVLLTSNGIIEMQSRRINTRHTHGTGCTLSSAIAAMLALGKEVEESVAIARDYVHKAVASAPQLGRGHGPLNHNHPLTKA